MLTAQYQAGIDCSRFRAENTGDSTCRLDLREGLRPQCLSHRALVRCSRFIKAESWVAKSVDSKRSDFAGQARQWHCWRRRSCIRRGVAREPEQWPGPAPTDSLRHARRRAVAPRVTGWAPRAASDAPPARRAMMSTRPISREGENSRPACGWLHRTYDTAGAQFFAYFAPVEVVQCSPRGRRFARTAPSPHRCWAACVRAQHAARPLPLARVAAHARRRRPRVAASAAFRLPPRAYRRCVRRPRRLRRRLQRPHARARAAASFCAPSRRPTRLRAARRRRQRPPGGPAPWPDGRRGSQLARALRARSRSAKSLLSVAPRLRTEPPAPFARCAACVASVLPVRS